MVKRIIARIVLWALSTTNVLTRLDRHDAEITQHTDHIQRYTRLFVDIHEKTPTVVYIVSTLGPGYFQEIPMPTRSMQEVFELTAQIKRECGAGHVVIDAPHGMAPLIQREIQRHE